jgi:multicomponent Na+:H+ antiporter subunit A
MAMTAALALILLAAALAPLLHGRLGHRAGWLLALLPAAIAARFAGEAPAIAAGGALQERHPWVRSFGLDLAFRVDGLALLFLLVILGIGALILIYGSGYLKGDPLQGRFFGYLLLFLFSMCGVVTADNTLLLFVFWELTGLASYLLIGFYHEEKKARASALQALLVTFLGGQALLAGLVLLGVAAGGTYSLQATLAKGPELAVHPWYPAIFILVALGALTKSAQVPFHFWLPGAMAAPAPVSAFLHSATMVNAGIFLLARLAPALGGTELWRTTLGVVGAATMLIGALISYPQTDLKRLLAFSTVSALGTMVLLLGIDTILACKAALLFFLVHALYKGALFMVAGTVDHEVGSRDVRLLSGLGRAMPFTAVAAGLAGLSMCGLPPLVGFIGKELVYEAKLAAPQAGWAIASAGIAANMLMVAVGLTVALRPFRGRPGPCDRPPHEGPWSLWFPPLALALAGVALGLFPGLIDRSLIGPAVSAVRAEETAVKLKLWHGINPVLILSALTVAAGFAVFLARHAARRIAARVGPGLARLGPARLYEILLEGTVRVAGRVSDAVQHGSLRGYVAVVVGVAAAGAAFAIGRAWEMGVLAWDFGDVRPHEAVLLVAMAAGALFAAWTDSRLAAMIGLGLVGFGVALVFGLHGAPDLALTQLLVETLTLVILVLVIFRLPRFTARSTRTQRGVDAALAGTFGAILSILTLMAVRSEPDPALRDFFVAESPAAKGRNVVNVILVDFRALDTLGEITVLAAAALGVGGLIGLRSARKRPAADPADGKEEAV